MPEDFRGLGDHAARLLGAAGARRAVPRAYAGREDAIAVDVVGRLKPGMSPEAATAALTAWASGRADAEDGARRGPLPISAETEAGHALERAARGAADLLADLLRLRADPDDWLRQRRQPAARARCLAPAGDRHPAVARRVTPAHHPAAAHGESAPCARGGGCGLAVSRLFLEGALYAVTTTMPPELARVVSLLDVPRRRGLAGAGVPGGWRHCLDGVLRARAGAAGHPPRTGADDARRSDEGRAPGPRATCPDRRPGRRIGPPPDLRRRVSAKCLCRRDRGSGRADERHGDGLHRQRATARRAAPGGDGPSVGGGGGGVVAGRRAAVARDTSDVRRTPARQARADVAGRPVGRVAGILRCARHRRRERARLHAGGTHRGGGRRGRVRDHRAPALAEWRRRRAGRAPRCESGNRTRSTPGAPPPPSRTVHGRRRRARRRGRFRCPTCSRVPGVYLPTESREPRDVADCCASAATPSRRGRRCSNASRASIPRWARSSPCGRSPGCRPTSCRSPSG